MASVQHLIGYHDIGICATTLGADALFARYTKDRSIIVDQVLNDPNSLVVAIWTPSSPLSIDNNCLCQMGSCDRRSPYSCSQCKNLRRLIDFRHDVIDTPFSIQCGSMTGKKFVIHKHRLTTPLLQWDHKSESNAHKFILRHHNLTMSDKQKCISGDSFTTSTLINMTLGRQFEKAGLPHILPIYTAFICKDSGYTMHAVPTIGTIGNLTEDQKYCLPRLPNVEDETPLQSHVTSSIITQLLVIIKEANKVHFSHGNPIVTSLVFSKDPISYKYEGVHVKGPITMQLSGFENSSATFNNVHYFPYNVKAEMLIEKNIFSPEIIASSDNSLFRLSNKTFDIYIAMRHIGFSLYDGVFDLYCFMVALMCDKSFYASVVMNEELGQLWNKMWIDSDREIIENMIKERHIDGGIDNTVDIIRGAWLRYDIVDYMWNKINHLRS